jgi:peptide/nickel transport system substrate-binding protein
VRSRRVRATALIAAVVLVAASCGGDDDSGGGSADAAAGATGATETTAGAVDAAGGSSGSTPEGTTAGSTGSGDASEGSVWDTPWVTEGVDPDAALKIGVSQALTTADPYAPGATVATNFFWMIYDRLFFVDRNSELKPNLVTDWEFTDAGLELTLRDDVTFHDGTPLDANAVKTDLDYARTAETSAYVQQLAAIQSIDVVDDHTVLLNLAPKTGATLPYILGGWPGIIVNPNLYDPETLKTSVPEGTGSGPYKISSWTPGDNIVTLERAGEYWNPAAGQAATVEMYVEVQPQQLVNAVTTGQYDAAFVGAPTAADAVAQAESDPDNFNAELIESYSSSGLFMRDQVDPIVREAISYALDRDAINALYEGTVTPSNQLYPEGHPDHSDDIDLYTQYDPAKAAELVETAPAGSTSLTLQYVDVNPSAQIAQLLQAQLAAVGITLELQASTYSSIFADWFAGKFDILLQGTAGPAHPALAVSNILMRGGVNWAAPDSALPELGSQLAAADDPALSDDERNEIYRGIFTQAAKEHWLLIWAQLNNTIYGSTDLVNASPELPTQYQSFPDFRFVAKTAG